MCEEERSVIENYSLMLGRKPIGQRKFPRLSFSGSECGSTDESVGHEGECGRGWECTRIYLREKVDRCMLWASVVDQYPVEP